MYCVHAEIVVSGELSLLAQAALRLAASDEESLTLSPATSGEEVCASMIWAAAADVIGAQGRIKQVRAP